MLVLSRRFQETIKFPQLDITIEILRIKGKSVRVGVDAPVEIKVVRGELFDENRTDLKRLLISAEDEHKIRNQLNTLTIASATAKRFDFDRLAVHPLHGWLVVKRIDVAWPAIHKQKND
jgi:carbon storage regulator CsrA